ncbi:MAG: 30S ribosomal protein S8 [Firmicutes bacterium RBG_13_65_8]|nr:MAG: 30S ribosomal protein S8 [Firmicutes bacterium RBG_13_65_8]
MLTRIRNANMVYRDRVEVPGSRLKKSIAQILKDEGFIRDFEWNEDNKQGVLKLHLKYGPNKEKVINGLKRISKPGLRVYVGRDDVPKVLGGLGLAILSTSLGVLSDRQARRERVGGEVICYVW